MVLQIDGLDIYKNDAKRLRLIKGLYDMQKHNGEIPGLTFEEYKQRFDEAHEALGN